MASPVSRTQRRIPVPHRKPLQSKNSPSNLADVGLLPKRRHLLASRDGKENRELAAARGRSTQLQPGLGKSEASTWEMDAAFERWTREAWRRLQELLLAEKDIRRVAMAKERRSSARSSAFPSLRAIEEEKKRKAPQLQGIINGAEAWKSCSIQQKRMNNLLCS